MQVPPQILGGVQLTGQLVIFKQMLATLLNMGITIDRKDPTTVIWYNTQVETFLTQIHALEAALQQNMLVLRQN